MLVYGDIERVESAAGLRAAIAARLRSFVEMPRGLERHAALVNVFVESSSLVQAIADAEFDQRGYDVRSPLQDVGARLLLELARLIDRSWRSGFAEGTLPAKIDRVLHQLNHPAPLRIKTAEGYAHYALYPETYLEAARASGLGSATRVIGIRSIGAGLAALVSAALDAEPPITVRPVGHPFGRELRVSDELTREIAACRHCDFAIADEGPGLSGSSFIAVSHWLEANGVPPERIHLFPSHGGEPGAAGSEAVRQSWRRHPRHFLDLDPALLATDEPAHQLATWVAGVLGTLDAPLEDISGGGWRPQQPYTAREAVPADPRLERRKFLARTGDGTWLVKFAGIGELGERKLGYGRLLAEAGLTPEVAGLCHGFIVQRWEHGSALQPVALTRDHFVESLGVYLGFRSRHLAACNEGASLLQLAHMAEHNTHEALGPTAAAAVAKTLRRASDLESLIRPIASDNRMHRWEWVVAGDGRLLKTDALDHCASHDLIGCQDVAWDIAGAFVEHELSDREGERLRQIAEQAGGAAIHPELIRLLLPCYLAFQLGLWTMAAESNGAEEEPALRATARRYADRLRRLLS